MRFFFLFCFVFSSSSFGFQARQCAQNVWMKKGLLRKYDVKYSTIELISFKTSSDEGSTKVSSASSTQGSTMSLDPGITTGQSESSSQFSSTYGDCSIWANNDRWLRREFYVAENIGGLRSDIASGDGEYLDTFLFLSGCPSSAKGRFSGLLHGKYAALFGSEEAWGFASDVDKLLQGDATLSTTCDSFPTGA